MSFFAVLFALVLEQIKPLPRKQILSDALGGWAHWCGQSFDAGRPHHAWVVWCMSVLLPALGVALLYRGLVELALPLGLLLDVAVLYLTLGFRQFSHYFTDIREALERGDEARARELLQQWRHLDASELPRAEFLRHVIEQSLLAAHRHVFGVFFWFVLLSALGLGPAGAVLYRMADFSARFWKRRSRVAGQAAHERLAEVARAAYNMIDHLPARLTAFGFAVVGNFEDAIERWRRDAAAWPEPNDGVILAAAAGAVGVQLGGMTSAAEASVDAGEADHTDQAQSSTFGMAAQPGHLRSVAALVWRSVVLWMLLVALLMLARLLG